jgi:hypothetical protein
MNVVCKFYVADLSETDQKQFLSSLYMVFSNKKTKSNIQ